METNLSKMKIGISDIETNNLYHDVTMFHCAWIIDAETGDKKGFRPNQLKEYIHELCKYDVAVFHNGIDYDIPTLCKLAGKFKAPRMFDTYVLSRMLEPDRPQGHSLKSWGIALGILKGDYGEQENAWEVFTEDMYKYCQQDCNVTLELFKHLCEQAGFDWHNPPSSVLEF